MTAAARATVFAAVVVITVDLVAIRAFVEHFAFFVFFAATRTRMSVSPTHN